jgi:hypothetical protein
VLPQLQQDESLFYRVTGDVRPVRPVRPHQEHKRHTRNYAEGRLGPDCSFYFRGPENALNIRAHNITMFLEIATGIDDRTWEHHRRTGDYSRWFRESIKDKQLADKLVEIEKDSRLDSRESRKRIAEAVSNQYTVPARLE